MGQTRKQWLTCQVLVGNVLFSRPRNFILIAQYWLVPGTDSTSVIKLRKCNTAKDLACCLSKWKNEIVVREGESDNVA